MSPATAAKPVQMLRRSGKRLAWLREQERVERARIASLVGPVRAEGYSKSEVARMAGISRPHLDDLLRRQA